MRFSRIGIAGVLAAGLAALGGAQPLTAQDPAPAPATAAPAASPAIDRLYRDVERAQSLRTVKQLQTAYQQYAQFGMWDEMASLFSEGAEAIFDDAPIRGRAAIRAHFLSKFGGGKPGLAPGALHNQLIMGPVVTLSYDGGSAVGRWTELTMTGGGGAPAYWAGGMQINTYIKEGGRWKISRLHSYPQFAGPHETGWRSIAPVTPIVPYPFTPSQAGRPVPEQPGDLPKTPSPMTLPQIERWIQDLADEDQVRNLQNIYGYYIDRKMWDDVTDLFADDGVLEIAGVGVFHGIANIRRALERDGPAGLKTAEINDRLQLSAAVSIETGGVEARARGTEFGMLTPKQGEAYWTVGTFLNRYVKTGGTWRIREMRIFPKLRADYYQGWANGEVPDDGRTVPMFFQPNPATGQQVVLPPGARVVGGGRLVAAPVASAPADSPATAGPAAEAQRIIDLKRRLEVAKAYDAVENISSAWGAYLDDLMWDEWTALMSKNGWRIQGAGWYVGRDHLYRAMTQGHLIPPSATYTRDGVRTHQRLQPVIHVTPDGRTAKLRTRMLRYFATPTVAGGFGTGMYPNDAAVLEEGVWRMDVNVIDQVYYNAPTYQQGWARPPAPRGQGAGAGGGQRQGGAGAGRGGEIVTGCGTGLVPTAATPRACPIDFPPDVSSALLSDFRRKGFNVNYPEIKPMWFHYRNPVSGRVPPHYCPDVKTCYGY